jgi:RHS repeat-associated protein
LNLPFIIYFAGDNKITYLYNASGQKVGKKVTQGNTITTTDYLSGFQYKNEVLQFFPHAEGYVNATQNGTSYTFNYVYNYTDHLGNIRLSYSQDPSTNVLKIIEENHYYPFGLKHTGYNSDQMMYVKEEYIVKIKPKPLLFKTSYNYKYNGKELQDELGLNMYDYGARNYDPALGRWMNMDPLAEQSRRWTPYNYAYNNPMYFVDPDGMQAIAGDDWKTDKDGNYVYDYKLTKDNSSLLLKEGEKYVGSKAEVTTYTKETTSTGTSDVIISSHSLNEDGSVTDLTTEKAFEPGETQILPSGKSITSISTSEKAARAMRTVFDGAETIGGFMELGGLIAAPFTQGGSLVSTEIGAQISLAGAGANVLLDVFEGDYKMASYRAVKTVAFLGMGKAIDKTAGSNVTDKTFMSLYMSFLDKFVIPAEPKR